MTSESLIHDPDSRDHFEVMGLPRRLQVDIDALTKRYYELSRQYHPDFMQDAPPKERIASMTRTAAVNAAQKTLSDPFARGRWWLETRGEELGRNNNRVPNSLMMLVLEIQELLDNARVKGDEATLAQVNTRRDDVQREFDNRAVLLDENFTAWDESDGESSPDLLTSLKAILSEASYLRTLIRDMDGTLEQITTGTPRELH
jgi:molecular chaperone HscB